MARRQQPIFWPQLALALGLGGAILAYLNLALTQSLIQLFGGGRIVQGSAGIPALIVAVIIVGAIEIGLLTKLLGFRLNAAAALIVVWLTMYLVVWIIGLIMAGMSLPVYLVCWALFGLAAGAIFGGRQRPAAGATLAPRHSAVVRSTEFGRSPRDTVVLLSQHARSVTGPISSALPSDAPEELRAFTVRAVLDRTLRDWWENGNTAGLTPKDINDLKSFVELAAALAAQPRFNPSHREALSHAIYRATLGALLDDWLERWNADGVDGPPRR